jgi:V/A-type H+-transporting ATPase subunit I
MRSPDPHEAPLAERLTGPQPLRMRRVALVAPTRRWRATLACVADAGLLQPELASEGGSAGAPERGPGAPGPRPQLARTPEALEEARREGRLDILAGEQELDRVTESAPTRGGVRALLGWAPAIAVAELSDRVTPLGGAVVELDLPRGIEPPTALAAPAAARAFRPLVETYATVPYRNVDPTFFAGAAYVIMFGMMFGDVGDGLLLAAAAFWIRSTRRPGLQRLREVWPLVLALGASAALFGLLYGEFFGPTGLVPRLWIAPLEEPTKLLAAGIGVGALLLGVAYGIGIVNRWREGGIRLALYAPTGIAGSCLFVGLGLIAAGVFTRQSWFWVAGGAIGAAGLALSAVGLKAGTGPGTAGTIQAGIELVDLVVRLGANIVSFARLAAFGLTHAALATVVWDATRALWGRGAATLLAIAIFVVGHVLIFGLEALVAGVQALRLEYYELFSRLFVAEGRPFRPWHVPFISTEEDPCSPGS